MRKRFLITFWVLSVCHLTFGQISGTYTIPGSPYPTLASAVTALNTQGVGTGGVTFNVTAGYTETLTSRLDLTATGTVANHLTFQKSGSGADPVIIAYPGSALPGSNIPDGMWSLNGSDYVTIDGIDLQDATSNNTPALQMEYGYGLFKASATNGASNNIIRNCSISLNRNNNTLAPAPFFPGSIGIAVMACSPVTALTITTVTSVNGSSSNNKFYNNTIENANCCIAMSGYPGSSPFTFCDNNNDVGGSSLATANNLINFGGATGAINAACGIYIKDQWNFNVSFNSINNNNGSGVNHLTVNRGIWTIASSGASGTINNNTVTIKGGGTTSNVSAIENSAGGSGSGNTVNINNNTITNCTNATNTSGAWYGIWNNAANASNLNIQNNIFTNNSDAMTTGSMYLISNTGACAGTINITGNQLSEAFPGVVPFSGTFNGIYINAGTPTLNININGNNFSNISFTYVSPASLYFIFLFYSTSCANLSISSNTWINLILALSGGASLIFNGSIAQFTVTINSNCIINGISIVGGSGSLGCIGSSSMTPPPATSVLVFNGNNFSNVTSAIPGSGGFEGIGVGTSSPTAFPKTSITNNIISNISFSGNGSFYGIVSTDMGNGATDGSVVSGNTITNVISGGSEVRGMFIAGQWSQFPIVVFGNTIGNILATNTSQVYGCMLGSSIAGMNFYKNKVYGLQSSHPWSTIWGLYITGSNPLTIYDNFISDIRDDVSNTYISVIPILTGIYIQSGSIVNVYDNSIFMNAVGVGSNFSTAGIYTSTVATLDMRNNIVVNNSIAGSSGRTVAYWRSNSTLASYSNLSNNNDLYAGTPGAMNLIFYDGTNSIQTLTDYKTFVSPRDSASVTEIPPFVNVATAPFDLHLQTTVLTLCESGGSVIAGPVSITTDYDNDPRYPNPGYPDNPLSPASAPDIGADEFAGNKLCSPAGPAGGITGPVSVCANTAGKIYTVAAIANATGYVWSVPTGALITAGNNTTSITVTFGIASGNVSVYGTGLCGNGSPSGLAVIVNPLPVPTITGSNTLCVSSGYYNYSTESGMSNYQWNVSPGGSITFGSGTNQIQVIWNIPGSQWITVNYTDGNGCSAPSATQFDVVVKPLPGTAGNISGADVVCAGGQGITYSIEPVQNALTYVWTVPAGASILSGAGTNSITVGFDTNSVSGNVIVYGNNLCGNGSPSPPFHVTVTPIPGAPVIFERNDTLFSSAVTGNQWYYNDSLIPGAVMFDYLPIQSGEYWDQVSINNCSSDTSNHILFVLNGIGTIQPFRFNLFPVPNRGCFTITMNNPGQISINLYIYNDLGVKIYELKNIKLNTTFGQVIDLRPVSSGIYTIVIHFQNDNMVRKFLINR